VATHLSRRPRDNPVHRLRPLIEDAVTALPDQTPEYFHAFAFATLRQLGATAQLAAGCLRWIEPDDDELATAAKGFESVSVAAKSLQFVLARASRGDRSPSGPPSMLLLTPGRTPWTESSVGTGGAER
jgi:hypothetical protein